MHVIDEGIFRGFIPINHHWVNDDPGTYYDISNSVRQTSYPRRISKSSFSAFDLEGYQVVRGEFMQIRYEGPTMSISNERISFNKFCVQKFDSVAYIQLPGKRVTAPCLLLELIEIELPQGERYEASERLILSMTTRCCFIIRCSTAPRQMLRNASGSESCCMVKVMV